MTSLRPVTEHWPSSAAVWDDSNLPFGVVVTPLLGVSPTKKNKNQDAAASRTPAPSLPLSCVPKCLHCGAPHPLSHQGSSHSHKLLRNTLLCFLCGKACSTRYHDQAATRVEEHLPRDQYEETVRRMQQHQLMSRTDSSTPTQEFALPLYEHVASLPAHVCPPVYWIAIDGSCHIPGYWNTIGSVLQRVTRSIPSYVHVGMLVASSESLVIWDLASPVPHARHLSWPLPSDDDDDVNALSLPLSPASSFHLPAALRALVDRGVPYVEETNKGMPLGATVEAILDTLRQHTHPGNHVGVQHDADTMGGAVNGVASTLADNRPPHSPSYAGGRVLCILSGPPVEVGRKPQHEILMRTADGSGDQTKTSHGTGGFGGSCAILGKRYVQGDEEQCSEMENIATDQDDAGEDDPELGTRPQKPETDGHRVSGHQNNDDMTPSNLISHYPRTTMKNVEAYFHDLGMHCAEAAIGVDLLVLTSDDDRNDEIGLPLLRGLSDRSGAAGPLLFSVNDSGSIELFEREVESRAPWNRPQGFGSLLRLRLSPGFHVDTTPVDPLPEEKGPQLAPLYASCGCMGPATALDEHGLWMIGACDDSMTLSLDLRVDNTVTKDSMHLDGYGDVTLSSAMQSCVAYTTVERDQDGGYVTVRKMRVTSLNMPLAHDTETLYSSLDPEVLAVILFHKLTLASLDDGLVGIRNIGATWLLALLVSANRSAKQEELRLAANTEHGLVEADRTFFVQERLLDRPGGELTTEEILLGQGHERLKQIPLIVFSLLQCDALRPSTMLYRPSLDARCAASVQMYSMSPCVLARCIAPRLELWEDHSDELVLELVDLQRETILFVAGEQYQNATAFFLDSPRELLILHSNVVLSRQIQSTRNNFTIGDHLHRSIDVALQSYRVPPPVVCKLDCVDGDEWVARLMDSLIEDSCTVAGESFRQWKREVANKVNESIG